MTYRPWMHRRFGVELEMRQTTTDRAPLTAVMLQRAVRVGLARVGPAAHRLSHREAGYYHSSGETWDVKTDSSCGWEVAAPALMLDEEAQNIELREVSNALAALNPTVDRSCGMHVHVEITDYSWRDLQALVTFWARYEPFFFSLCPASRRGNAYCRPTRQDAWRATPHRESWGSIEAQLRTATSESQFWGIAEALGRGALNIANRGRIEFRLAGGTVQYEKIIRWAQLLLSVVQRVKHPGLPKPAATDWPDAEISAGFMFRVLGLSPSAAFPEVPEASLTLRSWVDQRIAQFAAEVPTLGAGRSVR